MERVIVIDPESSGRQLAAEYLRRHGYEVIASADPADGATSALAHPPSAVIADLWMPSISGVQLCRLLRSEPATHHVPIVLRGDDDKHNRFWAGRAGASGYVVKRRMQDLLRVLTLALSSGVPADNLLVQLSGGRAGIRDRIAAYLDQALFDSVIAAEVRALSVSGGHQGGAVHYEGREFTTLFERFIKFLCQVISYRWVALAIDGSGWVALHAHPAWVAKAEEEARAALALPLSTPVLSIANAEALQGEGIEPVVHEVRFLDLSVGRLAFAPRVPLEGYDQTLVSVLARELGGPIRMASLVEESQRLATVDLLTTLLNRRSLLAALAIERERARRQSIPFSMLLIDVDHFKNVNDVHGHAGGDAVLAGVGRLLKSVLRKVDFVCRWGGEEFAAALVCTGGEAATLAAERLRQDVAALRVKGLDGAPIEVTASFGVAEWDGTESIEALIARADEAMYAAKKSGRNRVVWGRTPTGAAARSSR